MKSDVHHVHLLGAKYMISVFLKRVHSELFGAAFFICLTVSFQHFAGLSARLRFPPPSASNALFWAFGLAKAYESLIINFPLILHPPQGGLNSGASQRLKLL